MRTLIWRVMPKQFIAIVHGSAKVLMVYCARKIDLNFQPQKGWYALALDALPANFLESHGHEEIGVFETMKQARGAATRYARLWLRNQATIDPCSCKNLRVRRKSKSKPHKAGSLKLKARS